MSTTMGILGKSGKVYPRPAAVSCVDIVMTDSTVTRKHKRVDSPMGERHLHLDFYRMPQHAKIGH